MSRLWPPENDSNEVRNIALTRKDVHDAARLLKLIAGRDDLAGATYGAGVSLHAKPDPANTRAVDRELLFSRAQRAVSARRARANYLNKDVFGEPAWDILLALYISDFAGGRRTLGSLSQSTGTPPSTMLRWFSYLEEEGLVERRPHPTDKRTAFVQLAEKGRAALDKYFSSTE